jgi:hypothetical protein
VSRVRRGLRIAVEVLLLAASIAGIAYLGQRAVSEGLTTRPLPTVTTTADAVDPSP